MFEKLIPSSSVITEVVMDDIISSFGSEDVSEVLSLTDTINQVADKLSITHFALASLASKNTPPTEIERALISANLESASKLLGSSPVGQLALECDLTAFNSVALEGLGSMIKGAYDAVMAFLKRIWNFFFGKKKADKELSDIAKRTDMLISSAFDDIVKRSQKMQAELSRDMKESGVTDWFKKIEDELESRAKKGGDLSPALKSFKASKGEVITFPSKASGVESVTVPIKSGKSGEIILEADKYLISGAFPKSVDDYVNRFNSIIKYSPTAIKYLNQRFDLLDMLLDVDLTKEVKVEDLKGITTALAKLSDEIAPTLDFPGGTAVMLGDDSRLTLPKDVDATKTFIAVLSSYRKLGGANVKSEFRMEKFTLTLGSKAPKLEKLPDFGVVTDKAGELAKKVEVVAKRNKAFKADNPMLTTALSYQTTLGTDVSILLNLINQIKTGYQKMEVIFKELNSKYATAEKIVGKK